MEKVDLLLPSSIFSISNALVPASRRSLALHESWYDGGASEGDLLCEKLAVKLEKEEVREVSLLAMAEGFGLNENLDDARAG